MAKKADVGVSEEKGIESIERFDVIDGYVLESTDKLERVINGEVKRAGVSEGGLLEQYNGDWDAIPPALVLAHYDKLAGFITKDVGGNRRVKIKTGSFWDFQKQPRSTPEVKYLFKVGGEMVEVDDPAHLAAAVTTVETAIAEKEAKSRERKERARRKSLIKGDH